MLQELEGDSLKYLEDPKRDFILFLIQDGVILLRSKVNESLVVAVDLTWWS